MRSANVHLFEREAYCTYRGEEYRVRDNGEVLRRSQIGKRKRPLDETWTFGTPSASNGYMSISEHKVHRIVATAFHGPQPTYEGSSFVHESCGTFFAPEGAEKHFTLNQGLPWEGGESIDDYC